MTRHLFGPHIENANVNYNADQRDAFTHPLGAVTVLHLFVGQMYPYLRQKFGPALLIHIRMYAPNWTSKTPAEWAKECYGFLSGIPGLLQDPYVIITFGNEPNLQCEGASWAATATQPSLTAEHYDDIWRYFTVVHALFRALAGDQLKAAIGTVPLADGHDVWGQRPEMEYQRPSFKELLAVSDIVVTHHYLFPDGRGSRPDNDGYIGGLRGLRPRGTWYPDDPGGVAVQYPDWPWLNAEWGNFLHEAATADWQIEVTMRSFHECLQAYQDNGRCVGCTIFIFDSDDANAVNRLQRNRRLTERLAELLKYTAAPWPQQRPQGGGNVKTAIALVASNQDRNLGAIAGYSEAGGMKILTEAVRDRLIAAGFTVAAFVANAAQLESQDKTELAGLHNLCRSAKSYLDSIAADRKLCLHLHSDAAPTPYSHTAYLYQTTEAEKLGAAIARRVQGALGTTKLVPIKTTNYVYQLDLAPHTSALIEVCAHDYRPDLEALYGRVDACADAVVAGVQEYLGIAQPAQPSEAETLRAQLAAANKQIADIRQYAKAASALLEKIRG